jgi:hypothetical protein
MSLIKGLPRGELARLSSSPMLIIFVVIKDRWEWGILTNRFLVGTGVCLLSILNIGSSKPVYDSEGNPTDSKIWFIAAATSHLLCAIIIIILYLCEHSWTRGKLD